MHGNSRPPGRTMSEASRAAVQLCRPATGGDDPVVLSSLHRSRPPGALVPAVTLITDNDTVGAGSSDEALIEALEELRTTVDVRPWNQVDAHLVDADLVVIRDLDLDPERREGFLTWALAVQEQAVVCNPVDVLRWNSHRSYLLELEERGAPVVPTAWTARGDNIDLAALMADRGWERALIAPAVLGATTVAVPVGEGGCQLAAGQGALDRLLRLDDVTIQALPEDGLAAARIAAIVVDGRVSHVLRRDGSAQAQAEPVVDAEAAALAEWVVEATGVELAVARVELQPDELGTLQLVGLDAVTPDLGLHAVPEAAATIAAALLRRLPDPP